MKNNIAKSNELMNKIYGNKIYFIFNLLLFSISILSYIINIFFFSSEEMILNIVSIFSNIIAVILLSISFILRYKRNNKYKLLYILSWIFIVISILIISIILFNL